MSSKAAPNNYTPLRRERNAGINAAMFPPGASVFDNHDRRKPTKRYVGSLDMRLEDTTARGTGSKRL
jgi:hypothetical protein